jgi:hypothetical protein
MADGEPNWPSPIDVLAARQNLDAHDTTVEALYDAHTWAEAVLARAVVANEPLLIEALDDKLGQLQDEATLQQAAGAVPLGVGGDGLLAAGPKTAAAVALLGEALGRRYNQIRAARRVVFDHVHPKMAPWMEVVNEDREDGLIWKSEFVHLASGAEPPPWTGGAGGELHFAIVEGIRLRCMMAAQLDEAGYDPPGIYLQTIRA